MLRIYDVALEMVADAGRVAGQVERYDSDLARQLRRAAASVVLNIAEGFGNTGGHKRQRYQSALGSAREVIACIEVAWTLKYVGEHDVAVRNRLNHVIGTLVRLARRA